MCHDHLEVELNKNINFIIGKNGSGKSAILTGLVVGLGGNASVTNRGTSIKGKLFFTSVFQFLLIIMYSRMTWML